jgi:hypothetical protein
VHACKCTQQDVTAACRRDVTPAPTRIKTFRDLLYSPEGYESFKRFLTSEFSVENLVFWTEVVAVAARAAALCMTSAAAG